MTSPFVIDETNLSSAWKAIVKTIVDGKGNELTPLLLTLSDFQETESIRTKLDASLKLDKLSSVQTVSETIFPNSLYELYGKDRNKLYTTYLRNLPRIKKIDPSNGRGTYFERLIAYNGDDTKINQLEIIISSLKATKIKRRSKLQASVFDPRLDHTNKPFQGFPCLQHVTFYISENGGLILNSFYAIQYLYQRGYGNWLGLINLGKFIANEAGVNFERFNCYIGVEKLDTTKTKASQIIE